MCTGHDDMDDQLAEQIAEQIAIQLFTADPELAEMAQLNWCVTYSHARACRILHCVSELRDLLTQVFLSFEQLVVWTGCPGAIRSGIQMLWQQ